MNLATRSLFPLALALFATPTLAQSVYSLYPGTTSFTSRGDVGTGVGETLQAFHKTHTYGIGDTGAGCEVRGFQNLVQDQDSSTQESYHIIIRAGTDANGPTTGSAPSARLQRLGPVTLPVVPGGGQHAWLQTITLTTPASIPCEDFFSIGAELTAAATFPADGMSTHVSLATEADQHANAIDNAWQIVGAATSATQPTGKRIWRYGMVVASPTLQMGNNGKYGNGGMFPLVGGSYSARVDNGEPNADSLLYMDIAIAPGFLLFPGTAQVYLPGVAARILTTVTLDANGDGTHMLGTIPTVNPTATVYFQSAIVGGTNPQLTNVQVGTFDQ